MLGFSNQRYTSACICGVNICRNSDNLCRTFFVLLILIALVVFVFCSSPRVPWQNMQYVKAEEPHTFSLQWTDFWLELFRINRCFPVPPWWSMMKRQVAVDEILSLHFEQEGDGGSTFGKSLIRISTSWPKLIRFKLFDLEPSTGPSTITQDAVSVRVLWGWTAAKWAAASLPGTRTCLA